MANELIDGIDWDAVEQLGRELQTKNPKKKLREAAIKKANAAFEEVRPHLIALIALDEETGQVGKRVLAGMQSLLDLVPSLTVIK